jgi:hypothetical protein
MQDLWAVASPGNAVETFYKMNSTRDVVVWWEIRRIPYDLALLAVGLVSVFAIEWIGGRLVPVGEDFVEPLILLFGVIAYAILANVCYSLGWITELIWKPGGTSERLAIRARLFRNGFCFHSASPDCRLS